MKMLIFKPRKKSCQCSLPDSLHTLGANESLLCNHVSDVLNRHKKACMGNITQTHLNETRFLCMRNLGHTCSFVEE